MKLPKRRFKRKREDPVGQEGKLPADNRAVHDHPVPPEKIKRYSTIRDPDAEQDIANYVHGEARAEVVQHVEKIKTEYVMGAPYEVWDVTTDKDRWWVITNPTNLYSQKHFPSLDYTLSFHIGLMMRLRSRPDEDGDGEPDPFIEVMRRYEQAGERHERAIEAEDYQAVGMRLRECLIALTSTTRQLVRLQPTIEKPQDANFLEWSRILAEHFCPGEKNKELRGYLKATSEKVWPLVNWLTHHRNATKTSASIAINACGTLIGHYAQFLNREKNDQVERCPRCSSRNLRSHYDINIQPDGAYYTTCGTCSWSNHPVNFPDGPPVA
jgi:hypothetical protein